jgi:hypothetical protein
MAVAGIKAKHVCLPCFWLCWQLTFELKWVCNVWNVLDYIELIIKANQIYVNIKNKNGRLIFNQQGEILHFTKYTMHIKPSYSPMPINKSAMVSINAFMSLSSIPGMNPIYLYFYDSLQVILLTCKCKASTSSTATSSTNGQISTTSSTT